MVEVPIERFNKMDLSVDCPFWYIRNYLIKGKQEIEVPDKYALMVPKEIKNILRNITLSER